MTLRLAVLSLAALAGGCRDDGTRESDRGGLSVNTMIERYKKLEGAVTADRVAQWRKCAAFVRPADGMRRGTADAAAGEWRFLTYLHFELAAHDVAPGVADCDPLGLPEQRRYPRLSSCGEVVGEEAELDCACQKVEISYMAAYNQAILRSTRRAIERNCAPRSDAADLHG